MLVGPDINRAAAMNARGELSDEWLRLVREGGDRWPGDQHLWLCEPATLQKMAESAGFYYVHELPVESVPDAWPVVNRYAAWQCAVSGVAG